MRVQTGLTAGQDGRRSTFNHLGLVGINCVFERWRRSMRYCRRLLKDRQDSGEKDGDVDYAVICAFAFDCVLLAEIVPGVDFEART